MGKLFRRGAVTFVAGIVGATIVWSSAAQAQGEPPGRVGRLAFTQGTVSFHDDEQSGWTQAVVNTPLTSGDAIWTEPNARSEISLPGTRIRMDGATELDMLALDDSQTRMQLAQGRIDVRTFTMDTGQPYQIVTPRGTISLQQQGDYYVEAGSTQDPTRLGVRSGAAQIQALNGQTLAVRPGEVAEVLGDAGSPQLRTVQTAPPAPPAYWAGRDRQVSYDQPPQYLSADYTGYEDLNANGSWINDGSYGQVWVPRAVPSGWAPYRSGHWSYVRPWGWTWIDDQPWGFAPYHYGRWANSGGRWVWVPPQREARPVYAPALVAFVGGLELAVQLGNRSAAPVGWFPLGPREVYVPSYTTNRDYYQRINRAAQIQDQVLEDRWQRAQRREAFVAGQNSALMNQRFATVVPTTTFVRSQPVMRAALQVPPAKIAAAPVAPVAAPPAPTASVAAVVPATAPATTPPPAATASPPATRDLRSTTAPAPQPAAPVAKTAMADMPTLARPAATTMTAAPGPKVATVQPKAPTADQTKQAVPALAPRQGVAPPELKGATTPAPAQPAKPGEPPRQQQASPQPQAAPQAAPKPAAPAPAPAPQPQARPEPAKPAEPPKQQQATPQPQATPPAAPKAAAPAPAPAPQPPHQQPPQQQQATPQPQATPPAAPKAAAPAPAPQPPHQQPPQQQATPQPQHPQPAPPQANPPQRQAAPPPAAPAPQPPTPKPPNQAQAPAPQPHPAPQPQAHPAPQPAPQQKPDDKK